MTLGSRRQTSSCRRQRFAVSFAVKTHYGEQENGPSGPFSYLISLEATGGFEPPIRVLQTPALTTWLRRPATWCRGGDLNPYALTGTAPSRRRVYLFHHLGSTTYLSDFARGRASIRPGLAAGPQAYYTKS